MVSMRLAATVIAAAAVLAVPQYGFARPDAATVLAVAQTNPGAAALPGLPVDPIITGRRGPTVADAGWSERALPRHRCSFCSGYQAFPQE